MTPTSLLVRKHPEQISMTRRREPDMTLPLQVAREVAAAENLDWDSLCTASRIERLQAATNIVEAYQRVVSAVPPGAVNRFARGSQHAAFVDGMLWHLGAVPFASEVAKVHAEALRRFGPAPAEASNVRELEVAHG